MPAHRGYTRSMVAPPTTVDPTVRGGAPSHTHLFSACSQAQTRMLLIQAPRALFFHGLTAPKSHQPRTPAGPFQRTRPHLHSPGWAPAHELFLSKWASRTFIRQGGRQPMSYFLGSPVLHA